MQNLVVFMEPSENAYDNVISLNKGFKCYDISFKDGNKCFNRFCIDEDAAFELSVVHYLKESSEDAIFGAWRWELKGKGNRKCIYKCVLNVFWYRIREL